MDRLPRRFWRLTVLNILANLTIPLVGLVDAGMLGHLPDLRFLAGVALASVVFDYLYWPLNFLRLATTGLTAQSRGRGDREGSYATLYRSLVLAGLLAALVLLLQVPIRELGFWVMQVSPELQDAASAYFDIRIWTAPATLGGLAFLGWYLGREESGHALVMTVVANLANVAFNYLFIIHMDLNAFGAGLATLVAQYLQLAVALALFARVARRGGGFEPWRWARVVHRQALFSLLRLNRDIFIRTFCLTSALAGFTAASSYLGTTVLVANTLLIRLFVLCAYFVDGAAFALESLGGRLWGEGDLPSLRRVVRMAIWASLAMTAVFLTGLLAAPDAVLGLLTDHQEILALGASLAWWLVPVLGFGAVAFVYDGLFLGLARGATLRNAMLLSTLGVFVPLATVALWKQSNTALWWALSAWMVARAISLGVPSRRLLDGHTPTG